MRSFKDEVNTLIKEGEIGLALEHLEKVIAKNDKNSRKELTSLQSWYNKIKKENNRGTVSIQDYEITTNKIRQSLIDLLDTDIKFISQKNSKAIEEIDEILSKRNDDSGVSFAKGASWLLPVLIIGLLYFVVWPMINGSSGQATEAPVFERDTIEYKYYEDSGGMWIPDKIIDENIYVNRSSSEFILGGVNTQSIEIAGRNSNGNPLNIWFNKNSNEIRISIYAVGYIEFKYHEKYYSIERKIEFNSKNEEVILQEIDSSTMLLKPVHSLKTTMF